MFFLQFTITPRRSAEFGSDAGGAYVCCRIERPKLQDAVDVARSNIVQRGWIVDEPDEAYVVDGSNHPPGTAGRDYFEQALTDLRRRHGYWKGFAATLRGYDRGLLFVFRHSFAALLSTLVLIGVTGYLYVTIPKGFFPEQDTGFIFGQAEARQDISFAAMSKITHRIVDVVRQDPAVSGVFAFTGASSFNPTENAARLFIQLKPHDQRDLTSNQIIQRLRPKVAAVEGACALSGGGGGRGSGRGQPERPKHQGSDPRQSPHVRARLRLEPDRGQTFTRYGGAGCVP